MKINSGYPQSVKTVFDPDQALQNAGPDLAPNCLQRVSAESHHQEIWSMKCVKVVGKVTNSANPDQTSPSQVI